MEPSRAVNDRSHYGRSELTRKPRTTTKTVAVANTIDPFLTRGNLLTTVPRLKSVDLKGVIVNNCTDEPVFTHACSREIKKQVAVRDHDLTVDS